MTVIQRLKLHYTFQLGRTPCLGEHVCSGICIVENDHRLVRLKSQLQKTTKTRLICTNSARWPCVGRLDYVQETQLSLTKTVRRICANAMTWLT